MSKVNIPGSGRLLGVALFLSVLSGSCSNNPDAMMGEGPPAMPVQLQEVQQNTVQDSSEFVGALEAQERVALRPEIDGRIVEIFVSPGDVVNAGDPVAQLRSDRPQAEVSGAIADVEAAQASRATAQARVSAAEAERQRAAADVELQTSDYERIALLVEEGAQSRQSLDRAINARDTAIASLRAAEEEVRVARAALAETEARLSRAQADQAVAREDLQEKRVVAPIAGVVGNIPAKVGDFVSTSDTLTNIIQNGSLDLNISVPAERSPQLKTGLTVELLDEQEQALARGRISFVSPEVNTTDQSILAKATFINNGVLRDGQLVRARVIWQTQPGVLVPTDAITRIAGQTFVYVVEESEPTPEGETQQIARQRLVTLGAIQGNQYHVLSGVNPGEQIVTSGILNLQDGSPVMTEQSVSEQ